MRLPKTIAVPVAIALLMLAAAQPAGAQSFPVKPIRIIVPYGAGGVTDLLARVLGASIAESTGQQVTVEPRPGGSSIIGMSACAKAAPDGYTVCLTVPDSLTNNPLLFADLPYDAVRDFAPVTVLGWSSMLVVANANAPISTFKEMVAYSKSNPGKLNWGTWGPASTPDIYLRWIERQAGAQITTIPYSSAAQANPALFAGQIDLTVTGIGFALPFVKSGKIKVLAVMGKERSSYFPDVPTLAEEGADPGLTVYFCIFAPAKTPPAIIERLNAEFAKAIRTPKVQDFYRTYTLRPEGNSAAEFAEFLKTDRAIVGKVFSALGIKPGAAPP